MKWFMALIELLSTQLYRSCDLEAAGFDNTAELEPLQQPPGQSRALDALEFGVDIQRRGRPISTVTTGRQAVEKMSLVRFTPKLVPRF